MRQAEALAKLTLQAVEGAALMARNAQAERDLLATDSCDMAGYAETAEGRRFEGVKDRLAAVQKDLSLLARAAGFNPKAPLGSA